MNEPSPEANKAADLKEKNESLTLRLEQELQAINEFEQQSVKLREANDNLFKVARKHSTENTKLRKDVNDLNNLLRVAGWGQGEIDNAVTVVEECEEQLAKLKEELEESRKSSNPHELHDCPSKGICEQCRLRRQLTHQEK